MTNDEQPQSGIILYQTEDGRTRIQCRFENETIWLTQSLIAELFQKDVRTVNEHLVNIFDEGELSREATVRNFRIVRTEGNRRSKMGSGSDSGQIGKRNGKNGNQTENDEKFHQ